MSDSEPVGGGATTYRGNFSLTYAPQNDREPDPGEVVWAWVSFEEDPSRGKDRPIVIVGETPDGRLAALMLSTRDHSQDRGCIRIGTGAWDASARESWARFDRVLSVKAESVRREGSALPRPVFDRLAAALGGGRARPRFLRRLLRRLW